MITVLTILDAALAVGVVVTIMMQSGKASGLGTLGGGGGNALLGQKKSKDEMLARLTKYLAGSWMALTLLLTILNRRAG